MTPRRPQPPLDSSSRRARHVVGERWPECGCRLCLDEHICPAAVTRTVRALVLAAGLGLAALALGPLQP